MTTLHYVKKARKTIKGSGIKKGDSYYWWQFAFSQKQVSKRRPRRSQYMTRSPYLSQIFDIEDDIQALTIEDLSSSCLDDFISQIENVRDEAETSLDNIPEQLKEASAGAMLQEYIDNLESWQSDLESVDLSPADDDYDDDDEKEDALNELLDEIQNIVYPG